MNVVGSNVARAGWLFRQSSFLHRWKRNWFVLGRDGLLRYFESSDSPRAEEVFIMRSMCDRIVTGHEVKSTNPPEEVRGGRCGLFELRMRDGSTMLLCADTEDDMRAWQIALDEARAMAPPQGPLGPHGPQGFTYQRVGDGYGGYPGHVISPPTHQVIQTAQGTTTVINQAPPMVVMADDPYYHMGGYGRYGRGRRCGRMGACYVARPTYW